MYFEMFFATRNNVTKHLNIKLIRKQKTQSVVKTCFKYFLEETKTAIDVGSDYQRLFPLLLDFH